VVNLLMVTLCTPDK